MLNPMRILLFLLFFLPSSLVLTQQFGESKNDLPEIGIVASDAITLDKEIQVGEAIMRQLRGQAGIISDPLLEEYLQDLGNRLVAQADNVKFPFEFFLLDNRQINAFAFFGGHIGVHTGLIFNAENESELASVLAHEISHVTQRHIARRVQAQQKASPLQLVSALGGLLLAVANPEAGIAALSAGNAAAAQNTINYTRNNEKEADRIGIGMLAKAGFDPGAAGTFFGKLAAKYRFGSKPPAFLLTHPLPESRIADARARANAMGRFLVPESLRFHLAKARIQARYYGSLTDNIAYFQAQLDRKAYVFKEAAQYGLALAYFEAEEYQLATQLIQELRNNAPENLFYLDTYTDLALAMKDPQKAVRALQHAAKSMPHNGVVSLNLANVYIKQQRYADAVAVLKDYLLVNPNHLLATQLLADAYSESKQKLEMHQTKAEIYALVGAYRPAIEQLHTAYNYAAERKLEKQRIRARIEQLREAEQRLKNL